MFLSIRSGSAPWMASSMRRSSRRSPATCSAGLTKKVPLSDRSEEHTSELQSHSDLHSFPTRRSSDLQEWVGTLDGFVNAQIKPQVTGYLLRRAYEEGSFVRQGQLLFDIDPRTFQAALDHAKGQLANAEGQLGEAEANQVKAQIDVDRYGPLAKAQAVSQQELDHAVQGNIAAQAQVRAAQAQIEAARAQMVAAQLNLGFTKIVSLIDGIAGIAQAQIGDLVAPASLLTTPAQVACRGGSWERPLSAACSPRPPSPLC